MNWTPEQDGALVATQRWLRNGDKQVFRLFGFAGTGKTTLAKHLAAMQPGVVLFGAFTGKAASVLRAKGCEGATTLHSLAYLPREKSRLRLLEMEKELAELARLHVGQPGVVTPPRALELMRDIAAERKHLARPGFLLNERSEIHGADLLVVDEASQVDSRLGLDLLSFGVPILVLGDPAQLPPIEGTGYFTDAVPDVLLTQVLRQARDNPVLDLATRVREGDVLPFGDYGTSRIIPRSGIEHGMVLDADQLLVGTNKKRKLYNARVRELLGHKSPLPMAGEKLVCLRNNHDIGLLNGEVWIALENAMEAGDERVALSIRPQHEATTSPLDVEAFKHFFLDEEKDMPWNLRREAEEFDYGYALTVHKAQGSEWKSVVLFDESGVFRSEARRWLYTGITRASEQITIVRGI